MTEQSDCKCYPWMPTCQECLKKQKENRMSEQDKRIQILKTIAEDMENDAKEFDGKPFNGRTVAEYNGNQGAAIAALADIVRSMLTGEME